MCTYISVGEQSFNHRMVMSRDSFRFQHQVETDVCAVTVVRKNQSFHKELRALQYVSTM